MELPSLSLADLQARYGAPDAAVPDEVLTALRADPRTGARALAQRIDTRRRKNRAEGQRLRHMLRFETALWEQGFVNVAGTDEVGVGPLAGPVVAAAVILPRDFRLQGLNDSKQLDAKDHARLCAMIKAQAVAWAVGQVEVDEIDRINIYQASMRAMRLAIEGLSVKPDHVLVDARTLRDVALPQSAIVKGDARSLSIAAASVVAKHTRDALMIALDATYPGYGFAKHKGYGVPEHEAALRALGPCAIHRRSFAPVRAAMGGPHVARGAAQLALFDAPEERA